MNSISTFLKIDRSAHGSLQSKLREAISEAIVWGFFTEGSALPSTRMLSQALGLSRNTVSHVYQDFVTEGVIVSADRRGFFVASNALQLLPKAEPKTPGSDVDWNTKITVRPSQFKNINHPSDWRSKKYTFIYGQHDRWLFPISNWRKCSRDSLSLHDMHDWTVDYVDGDDPLLLDAFLRRVLPRRGFIASKDQVLVTVGAQNALYMAAQCLVRPGTVVGVEDPSYPDARNIFRMLGAVLKPIPVDSDGMVVDEALSECDLVYVTPSHQSPTTVTMSPERRTKLLEMASQHDFLIVEDDYDTESRFGRVPSSALKSLDTNGRVIYITSLSKLLSPGLRVGFLVGPTPFIQEARVVRRLNIRHPAANNQRTIALFLKGGHYEVLLRRLHEDYEHRWRTLRDALTLHFPQCRIASSDGGSSIWLEMPDHIDTSLFAQKAYEQDVHVEPGFPHFLREDAPRNFLRLGFSSITAEDIPQGIKIIADVYREL